MKKEFEYAAIFSANDVKDNFIGCIALVAEECDETVILVEGQQGIDRIAEVQNTYDTHESGKLGPQLHIHENVARQYGINAEVTEALFNVAAIIRNNTRISFEESLKITTAITENYNISHK